MIEIQKKVYEDTGILWFICQPWNAMSYSDDKRQYYIGLNPDGKFYFSTWSISGPFQFVEWFDTYDQVKEQLFKFKCYVTDEQMNLFEVQL